jgi:hypothetical protein
MRGTFRDDPSLSGNQEHPMLTTVDRVIARLSAEHPMSDAQSAAVHDDATEFAAKLLENYKGQLSRRSWTDQPSRSNAS